MRKVCASARTRSMIYGSMPSEKLTIFQTAFVMQVNIAKNLNFLHTIHHDLLNRLPPTGLKQNQTRPIYLQSCQRNGQ